MLASVITSRVGKLLLDETGVLWASAELLDYLNAAITALVAIKPDASVTVASFTLTNATSKHTIPAGGVQFLGINRTISPASSAMTQVERNHLNHALPAWPSTAGTPQHFVHDKRDPKTFYIYPQPASGTNTVELVYASVPTRLTATGDTIPVDDIYENPLTFYCMAYAYAKNAKRGDLVKSQGYWGLFANSLGMRGQIQFPFSPDTPEERMQPTKAPQLGGPQE